MAAGLCACDKLPDKIKDVISAKQPVNSGNITEKPTKEPSKQPTKLPIGEPTNQPTETPQKETVEPIRLLSGEGHITEWDEDTSTTMLKVTYPFISVYSEDVETYPALYNALNTANEIHRNSQLAQLERCKNNAYEQYKNLPEDMFEAHELALAVNVRRADSKVVSLLYSDYKYEGGRHGTSYYWSENYDAKTGKQLYLEDVVTDKSIVPDMILEQLQKFWNMIAVHEKLDWDKLLNEEEYVYWTLDNHGLTFYFNPYVIAPYTNGLQIVTLSNEEYPELLKEEYKESLVSYGVELKNDVPFYYDVTGDGKVDEILCSWYQGYYGDPGVFSIYINGNDFSEEYYAYDTIVTFVHLESGENLLNMECLWNNDYKDTTVYKLGDSVKKINQMDGGMHHVFHENPEIYTTREVLVDPSKFCMDVRTNMLSSVTGYAEYGFGSSLMPERKNKMLTFDEECIYTLTLLQDMRADIYDVVFGQVKGTVKLSKGDKVRYYSTDNERYVYLMLKDGTIVRKEIMQNEWVWRIDGILIEDLFEGMFFAG